MTTFRTEGALVGAANEARALTALVCAYLDLWRKHANGVYGITIPREEFNVIFRAPTEKGVDFKIIYTRTHSREVAEYYDVDSDYFSESWGSSNISGYRIEHSTSIYEDGLMIPYGALLKSKEDMEKSIIDSAERYKKEQAEAERQRQIKEAEARLRELRGDAT
jgi:hypothetical protein